MTEKHKHNLYLHVGLQVDSEIEALEPAAYIAEKLNAFVEVLECGTKRLICKVAPDGSLLMPRSRE
jgi:hypothetical protein